MGSGTSLTTLTLPKLGTTTEEAFVAAVRGGALDAIAAAYDAHHAAVHSFARRLLHDEQAADDVVQEVFMLLPSIAHRLDDGCSLRGFLFGIAANRARDHRRSARRRSSFTERLKREPLPPNETPELARERRALAAALARALEAIPFDHRVTFVMREIEGCSTREVALSLNIPEATVRTRVFHAKQKLRALLDAEGVS
jgi:RNA polymerase sigma-70 factor, ECF subfamily